MTKKEPIIPDRLAFQNVEREYPNRSDAEKYRLAQADTILRLTGARDIAELNRMAVSGTVAELVRKHNEKMRQRTCN